MDITTKRLGLVFAAIAAFFVVACLLFLVPQLASAEGDDTSYPPTSHKTYMTDDGRKLAVSKDAPNKAWLSIDNYTWEFVAADALLQSFDEQGSVHYTLCKTVDEALANVMSNPSWRISLLGDCASSFDFTPYAGMYDEDGIFTQPFFVISNGFAIDFGAATLPYGGFVAKACEQEGVSVFTLSPLAR